MLLIVLDTVRAQNLSLYGYTRRTAPQLEQFGKRGVVFEQAVSTASWTLPSHASMFTGRYPHDLSVNWASPLDSRYPTLAERLAASGFVTGGFVANVWSCNTETGLSRGFVHYEDSPALLKQIVLSSSIGRAITDIGWFRGIINNHEVFGRKTAAEVNDGFLTWVSRNDQKPFFAFLNYYDAHDPYLPPRPFDEMFGPRRDWRVPTQSPWRKWSPSEIQAEVDAYDGSIAYLDQQLGLLFGELEKRGLLESTLVIITSDHGEEFGEHNVMSHGNSLYYTSVHVPLLISFPNHIPAGIKVREPTTLRDIPATVVDLLKMDSDSFPGTSLAQSWNAVSATRKPDTNPILSEVNFAPNLPDWFKVSKGNMKSLIAGKYRFIRNGDGSEELYDLSLDPGEHHNLAESELSRQTLDQFRTTLITMLGNQSADRVSGHHAPTLGGILTAR